MGSGFFGSGSTPGIRLGQRLTLDLEKLLTTSQSGVEQLVQRRAWEGGALTGSLNFHQRAGIGGHDIHVDLGTRILFVRKVETHSSVHDADADGRYATRDGLWVGEQVGGAQVRHGVDQGHVCPRHCRGAGATVGLEDITVEGDGVLTDCREIDARSK